MTVRPPQAEGEYGGAASAGGKGDGSAASAGGGGGGVSTAILLLPRLRGRLGGGQRPCGAAWPCRAEGPSPNPSRKREGR